MHEGTGHACKWYDDQGSEIAPPISLEQWEFRGGLDHWVEARHYTGGAGAWVDMGCVNPTSCNPVSSWEGVGTSGDGYIFCRDHFTEGEGTHGLVGMLSLLGLGLFLLVVAT